MIIIVLNIILILIYLTGQNNTEKKKKVTYIEKEYTVTANNELIEKNK